MRFIALMKGTSGGLKFSIVFRISKQREEKQYDHQEQKKQPVQADGNHQQTSANNHSQISSNTYLKLNYEVLQKSRALQKFVESASTTEERIVRILIIQFFRESAKQSTYLQSGNLHFNVSKDQAFAIYQQFTGDCLGQHHSDSQNFIVSCEMNRIFKQKEGPNYFKIMEKPSFYVEVTSFIGHKLLEIFRIIDFSRKPLTRKCFQGTWLSEALFKMTGLSVLKVHLRHINRSLDIRNKSIIFNQFEPSSNFRLTDHFKVAFQSLDTYPSSEFISCNLVSERKGHLQYQSFFDYTLIRKQQSSKYQIISFDLTTIEKNVSELAYQINYKREVANRIINKIQQDNKDCQWKGQNIQFSITHFILFPKILLQKIHQKCRKSKTSKLKVYQNVFLLSTHDLTFSNLSEPTLIQQFKLYSELKEQEVRQFVLQLQSIKPKAKKVVNSQQACLFSREQLIKYQMLPLEDSFEKKPKKTKKNKINRQSDDEYQPDSFVRNFSTDKELRVRSRQKMNLRARK